MENQTEVVRARISPSVKEKAEAIFDRLGLGHTDAIRLFYQQVVLSKGLPFSVNIPNATTRKAMKDTLAGKNVKRYKDTKQLFDQFR